MAPATCKGPSNNAENSDASQNGLGNAEWTAMMDHLVAVQKQMQQQLQWQAQRHEELLATLAEHTPANNEEPQINDANPPRNPPVQQDKSLYKKYGEHKGKKFKSAAGSKEAKEWIHATERIIKIIQCTKEEKVLLATFLCMEKPRSGGTLLKGSIPMPGGKSPGKILNER